MKKQLFKLGKKGLLVIFIVIILIVFIVTLSSRPKLSSDSEITQLVAPAYGNIISGSFDKNKLKPNEQWKKILTPEQYYIERESGTEVPFTGKLESEDRKGTYYSAGCNEPVFLSEQKYNSGTGWPSFWAPINSSALILRVDNSIPGEPRVEVLDKCGDHLGHLFNDGPQPTRKRYCMNSGALYFVPDKKQ